jgi:hypothetical protein
MWFAHPFTTFPNAEALSSPNQWHPAHGLPASATLQNLRPLAQWLPSVAPSLLSGGCVMPAASVATNFCIDAPPSFHHPRLRSLFASPTSDCAFSGTHSDRNNQRSFAGFDAADMTRASQRQVENHPAGASTILYPAHAPDAAMWAHSHPTPPSSRVQHVSDAASDGSKPRIRRAKVAVRSAKPLSAHVLQSAMSRVTSTHSLGIPSSLQPLAPVHLYEQAMSDHPHDPQTAERGRVSQACHVSIDSPHSNSSPPEVTQAETGPCCTIVPERSASSHSSSPWRNELPRRLCNPDLSPSGKTEPIGHHANKTERNTSEINCMGPSLPSTMSTDQQSRCLPSDSLDRLAAAAIAVAAAQEQSCTAPTSSALVSVPTYLPPAIHRSKSPSLAMTVPSPSPEKIQPPDAVMEPLSIRTQVVVPALSRKRARDDGSPTSEKRIPLVMPAPRPPAARDFADSSPLHVEPRENSASDQPVVVAPGSNHQPQKRLVCRARSPVLTGEAATEGIATSRRLDTRAVTSDDVETTPPTIGATVTAYRVYLLDVPSHMSAVEFITSAEYCPSYDHHLPFANVEVVGENDQFLFVRRFELHRDDEERPIYCTHLRGTRQIKVADAAKWSPHLVYRVPLRWRIPISQFKHSKRLRHYNWEECYTCFHAGKSEAWHGRRIACTTCPRSFHSTEACIQSGVIPSRHERLTWRCSYCRKYKLQQNEKFHRLPPHINVVRVSTSSSESAGLTNLAESASLTPRRSSRTSGFTRCSSTTSQCVAVVTVGEKCPQHLEQEDGLRISRSRLSNGGLGLFTTVDRAQGATIAAITGRGVSRRGELRSDLDRLNEDKYLVRLSRTEFVDVSALTSCAGRFSNTARHWNVEANECTGNNARFKVNRKAVVLLVSWRRE